LEPLAYRRLNIDHQSPARSLQMPAGGGMDLWRDACRVAAAVPSNVASKASRWKMALVAHGSFSIHLYLGNRSEAFSV
jgi:hypothetical protein